MLFVEECENLPCFFHLYALQTWRPEIKQPADQNITQDIRILIPNASESGLMLTVY